jgi:hypothetical protein
MELLLATVKGGYFMMEAGAFWPGRDAACPNQSVLGESMLFGTVCVYGSAVFYGQDFFYRGEKRKARGHGYADRWDSVEDYLSMLRGAG